MPQCEVGRVSVKRSKIFQEAPPVFKLYKPGYRFDNYTLYTLTNGDTCTSSCQIGIRGRTLSDVFIMALFELEDKVA